LPLVNSVFLVELVLPNLFRVLSCELEKRESLFLLDEKPEVRGLLTVRGRKRAANLWAGFGVVVVVVVVCLSGFLKRVLERVLERGELVEGSNLEEARERERGRVRRVVEVGSGTSEGACLLLLNAV
jgi:hypothetical protein